MKEPVKFTFEIMRRARFIVFAWIAITIFHVSMGWADVGPASPRRLETSPETAPVKALPKSPVPKSAVQQQEVQEEETASADWMDEVRKRLVYDD